MKYLGIKIHRQLIILLILGIIGLFSCKDSDVTDPIESPPEMPPVASMQMDFNIFPTSNLLPKTNDDFSIENVLAKDNWGWALVNGVAWQTLVSVGMIVPVAAFAESFNHDAEKLEDGSWMWTYEFTPQGGVHHTASLHADVDNSGVEWEMYISKANNFEDFLWFSGKSDLFATEGTWTIFHQPNDPTPWIGIEWYRNPEDSTGDIKYTNIVPNGAENGGFIHYGIVTGDIYDAFYEIFNKGKNNTTSIKWNRNSHEGRVMDMLHFGNNDWHCWDSSLEDIDCP